MISGRLRSFLARPDHSAIRLRILTGCALILTLSILYSAFDRHIETLSRKRVSKEKTLTHLTPLRQRHREARQGAVAMESRIASLSSQESIGSIVESTGIRGKNFQTRIMPSTEKGVERGDVRIDSLTSNELVNLLHRLEYGSKPIAITRAAIKVRFDDPSRIDLTLSVTLHRPEKGDK